MEFGDFGDVGFDFVFFFFDVFFVFFKDFGLFFDVFVFFLVLEMLFRKFDFLAVDFFLELRNLVVDNFVSSSDFLDFFLSFCEVFAVEITVAANRFIEILLLLEFRFSFDVLFLEFGD
jgi:hypothetical protein